MQTQKWKIVLMGLLLLGMGCVPAYPKLPEDDLTHAPYRNATEPIETRVEDLLRRMTLEEKIGQLILVENNSVHSGDITRYGIGGVLSGGGGNPDPNTGEHWREMVNGFKTEALNSRLSIPLLYGVDAVHGHTNVPEATNFPHAIGLGAAQDPDLVRRIGAITATELLATGVNWNFSPTLDVVEDTRWGRTYETFGSDPELVSQLGAAYLEGLQSHTFGSGAVMGTAKHYVGSGAMEWGSSTNPGFKMDQGGVNIDEDTLRSVHLPPFISAVEVGVQSVMAGHLTWEGEEIVANRYLLTTVLKEELGFQGFVVSDWYGIYEVPGSNYNAVITTINAGVDMVMVPYDYTSFARDMHQAIQLGDISGERLDDAVRRILRAKFTTGLFEEALTTEPSLSNLGSDAHRAVAREAVQKSLVLLQDPSGILPLKKDLSHILVAGSGANNLGRQSGGWTIEWQGIDGNWIPGTTILTGIQQTVSEHTRVTYDKDGVFPKEETIADVGIVVISEAPYAEGVGDNAYPSVSPEDLQAIAEVQSKSKKTVILILSGRPLNLPPLALRAEAIVAAWLPGSEGGGVADALFGDVPFTGTLPVPWPL